MKIRIDTILPEGLRIDCRVPIAEIDQSDLDVRISSDIVFKGSLNPFSAGIMLDGTFESEIETQCARCLNPFNLRLSNSFKLLLTKTPSDEEEDSERSRVDQVDCEQVTDIIDLTAILREQLILQIPLKMLCSDDCRGLCQQCGKNLNDGQCTCSTTPIDPRLLKLKQLFENK